MSIQNLIPADCGYRFPTNKNYGCWGGKAAIMRVAHNRRTAVRLSPAVRTLYHGVDFRGHSHNFYFFVSKKIKIMAVPTGMLRHLGSLCALRITGVLPSAFRRRFEPFTTCSIPGDIHTIFIFFETKKIKIMAVPTGIEPVLPE